MKKNLLIIAFFLLGITFGFANKKNDKIQRVPTNVFDLQHNTKSNFQFPITNYGVNFYDVRKNTGGGFWPRNSLNTYFFSSGIWFGAMKLIGTEEKSLVKLVEISYNPNTGSSWMVPGRISDGNNLENDIKNYRLYFSTDMNEKGEPVSKDDGPNWPLWKNNNNPIEYLGLYSNFENRNETSMPLGPAICSDEDIFCTYKDTDLNFYEGGSAVRLNQGFPLGIQYEQTIYSWVDEEKKDMIIIFYKTINTSKDTLHQCWFAPVFDVDLATLENYQSSCANDHTSYYWEEPYLNMSYAWTQSDRGEAGKGFGYLGITMILSPMIGDKGRPDNSKLFDNNNIPLGLRTFKNWGITEDLSGNDDRYNFISQNKYDGDDGAGDKRMMMASGPFEMYPGDTAMFAIQVNFALPSKGGEADGTKEDIVDLVRKVKNGKEYFLNEMITNIIETNNTKTELELYPNPATDIVYINYQPNSPYPLIKIYDLLGIEVYTGKVITDGKYIVQNIDFLQNGAYIICLIDDKNVISNKLNVIK